MENEKLILLSGLQGTGKSTVAGSVADLLSAEVLSTDRIRKESPGPPDYSEEGRQRIYNLLYGRVRSLLLANRSVVLDGTFSKRKQRDDVRSLAAETKADFCLLLVVAPEELSIQRIQQRQAAGSDPSDATVDVYMQQKKLFEPVADDENHFVITNSTMEDLLGQIHQIFST
jgi:uncharacterized protein